MPSRPSYVLRPRTSFATLTATNGKTLSGSKREPLATGCTPRCPPTRLTLAHLSRVGRGIDSLRQTNGLHACRINAHYGASVRRFLGIPDRRLLRGDQPLRHARRFHVLR